MASKYAIGITAFLQIILRISFFIEQRGDACSAAPTLASWIFLIAFLDILLDLCIYPIRYMHLPYVCQIVAETLITVLLTEFGSLVVWCTIEKITCKLSKSLLLLFGMAPNTYYDYETYILGTVTTATSLAILLFVGQATDHYHFLRKRSMRMCRKINSYLSQLLSKIHSTISPPPALCKPSNIKCYTNKCDDRLNNEIPMDTTIIYQPKRSSYKRNRSRSRCRSRSRR